MTRAPLTIMAVLAALLLGVWWLTDGRAEEPAPAPKVAPVAEIAKRVEAIRGLRFDILPKPVEVTPEQARREGLEDLDRSYPRERRLADEETLKLLGLIDPSVDLREVSGSVFSEGVAGYYDPRTKHLRVVRGAQTTNRFLYEITLAHELTHALEDQRFGLSPQEGTNDDRALARLALIEGSATLVMERYLLRYFSAEEALAGVLGSAFATGPDLPPFLQAQLLFPYTSGMAFVQELVRRAGGRWTLVDLADRARPPDSTEQVLHPEKYLRVEQPLPVSLDAHLGGGWRRAASGVWGEWATSELVGEAAAAGWGGDRYELWQRPGGACPAPCRARDALVMRWRWDTPAAARRFTPALRAWSATRPGPVAIAARGRDVTLVLAPDPALARRLARAG